MRAAGARELAKIEGEQTTWLLAQLINDPDREVALNAMDAVWDRPPSPLIVEALWNRATGYTMNQIRPPTPRTRMINIRGRAIQVYDQDYNNNSRLADGDVAADVLLRYKSPAIGEKLNGVFVELEASLNNPNDYRWRVISPNYGGDGARSFLRLVEAYKPKESVPALVKMLAMTNNNNDGGDTTINNNEKVRYSTRIDAAALLIKIIGQDPDDYNVRKYPNWGDRWLIKGGMDEENELVKRIQKWWKANAREYGVEVGEKGDPKDKELKPGALTPDPAVKERETKAAAEDAARKGATTVPAGSQP